MTLGIDEVDALARTDENIGMILRTGNTWDAVGSICHKVDGEWQNFDIKIGGPKVFNFRGSLDDALRSRCYVIACLMQGPRDNQERDDGERTTTSGFGLARPTSQRRHNPGGWGVEKTKAHFLSPEFMDQWKALGGELGRNVGPNRNHIANFRFLRMADGDQYQGHDGFPDTRGPDPTEKDIIADIYRAIKHDGTERNIEGLCVPKEIKIPSEQLRHNLTKA